GTTYAPGEAGACEEGSPRLGGRHFWTHTAPSSGRGWAGVWGRGGSREGFPEEADREGAGKGGEAGGGRGTASVPGRGREGPSGCGAAARAPLAPTRRESQLRLVLGLHELGRPGLAVRIRAAVPHPEYKPLPHLENDLALLKLDGKVKTSRTIRPLALPAGRQAVAAGARCSLAGWGLTHQNGPLARALQELDLRVLDARMCNNSRFWDGAITPRMLCLEAPSKGQGPCKGNSGGPLVCSRGKVAGILSFSSKACTNIFKPPVATAVAPYVSWIRKVIRH
uniref:Granzyme M n=1 Tax=Equus asinus asinus TaxID=83772 RepID=A0A8C4MV71_EQUAS